jgi:hypothetical protein
MVAVFVTRRRIRGDAGEERVMAPVGTDERWQLVRSGLAETAERFAELTRQSDPRAMATSDWTVADTAAHLLITAHFTASIVDPERQPLPFAELAQLVAVSTVEKVHDFNAVGLRLFTDRDPDALAGLLIDRVESILASTADRPPERPLSWLGGAQVPLAGVLAHLLNELQIHGRDIARTSRTRWTVKPDEAGLFIEQFFIGMLHHSYGRLLDDCEAPPRERRIAVSFRSDYTAPAIVVLHRGVVTLDDPDADADVRVSFDPVVLNLMLFDRVSRVRAVLSGKVAVRGRRPWLLPVFMRTVHMPT